MQRVPIAIVIRTPSPIATPLVALERSLLVRKRTWAKGVTKKGREQSRLVLSRRGCLVKNKDGELQSLLRYGAHSIAAPERLASLPLDDGAWYWEVTVELSAHNDHNELRLLVTGASTAEGYLAYGTEMLALLSAGVDFVQASDPTADIRSLWLPV